MSLLNDFDWLLIFGLVQNVELNPSGQVAGSHLHASGQVVSVIFSSAYDRQHEMGLSQILTLEALADFVDDGHEDKVKQHVQHHVAPVATIRGGGGKGKQNDDQHAQHDHAVADHVVHQNLATVILHQGRGQIQGVCEFSEGDVLIRQV